MTSPRPVARVLIACACLLVQSAAQDRQFIIEKAPLPVPLRSYAAPAIPPVRLSNSDRLHGLIRAGKLYLSVQDALALAIENNLGLEIDRYGPLLAHSALERARAGGPIRGVPSASAQVASVNAGVGVNGSVQSAGLSGGNQGGSGQNGGAASIQQVGAITPNLDPILQNTTTFAHLSQPQANTVVSQTNSLIQSIHTYNTVLQQGLLSGGLVQFRDYEQYLKENSPTDSLNPAMGPHMDLYLRHNLLQGFGVKLNSRGIRIAEINAVASRETFRSQMLDLCASVLSLYWGFVSSLDELKVRQRAVAITQKFYEDTKKEIAAGALPAVQLPRSESEAATRRQDLYLAEQNVGQQAALLKDAISRTPDPLLDAAEIIPLDRIEIPENDDLPTLRQLVETAAAKRPDVAVAKYRNETTELGLLGTANPLLPSLQVQLQTYNRGVAGTPQIVDGEGPNPYFVGGYGTALKQIFRRNFPNNQAGINFSGSLGNRQAQGDYGIDQLQYRQSQLSSQRDLNQIVVDISNQVSALRQSRARYAAARDTRILQEQLLEVDRKKFSYGIATFNEMIIDQRTLVAAQLSEVAALTTYARARISLDQVLGETLEKNRITLDEGINGRVATLSTAPQVPPAVK
ncbi:MAG: TolC family protein [Bryobacteraceae bacterium]